MRKEEVQNQNNQTYRQETKRQPLGDATNFLSNKLSPARESFKFYEKDGYSKNFGATQPVMTRVEFNKSFKEMKSLHKSINSYKPNISKNTCENGHSKAQLNVVSLNLNESKTREINIEK